MVCPKCQEGTITKVIFKNKKSPDTTYLCDYCEAIWFDGDRISSQNSHTLHSYIDAQDRECNLEIEVKEDWDDELAVYKDKR